MDTMIEFHYCYIPMTADNLKPFEELGELILWKNKNWILSVQ